MAVLVEVAVGVFVEIKVLVTVFVTVRVAVFVGVLVLNGQATTGSISTAAIPTYSETPPAKVQESVYEPAEPVCLSSPPASPPVALDVQRSVWPVADVRPAVELPHHIQPSIKLPFTSVFKPMLGFAVEEQGILVLVAPIGLV